MWTQEQLRDPNWKPVVKEIPVQPYHHIFVYYHLLACADHGVSAGDIKTYYRGAAAWYRMRIGEVR